MIRRPPRSTRTDTLFPYTTLFRSTLAKANGAKWDAARKSWHAPEGADPEKLARWKIDNQPRQKEAKSQEVEFADAMKSLGLEVLAGHPMMDGKTHRVPAAGDGNSEIGREQVRSPDTNAHLVCRVPLEEANECADNK